MLQAVLTIGLTTNIKRDKLRNFCSQYHDYESCINKYQWTWLQARVTVGLEPFRIGLRQL